VNGGSATFAAELWVSNAGMAPVICVFHILIKWQR